MAKIDHSPEFKPDDPQKDWGVDVGRHDSDKAKLSNAEENPNKINDNDDSLSNLENDANYQNNNEAEWDNNFTGDENVTRVARFANFLKKRGPIGLVIGILLSGGIVGLMYLAPAGIAFQLVSIFNNFSDDSSSALHIKTRLMMQNKMKNAFAESSDGKCNVKCKFGSVNDDFIKNLKANGFEVDSTKKSFGRHVINSIKFPDGTVVNNGTEFKEALKDTPRASSFNSVFNSKTAYFLNGRFGSILKTKFGLDKAAKLVSTAKDKVTGKMTSTKDNVKNSLRKALGLSEIDVNAPDKKTNAEKIKENPKYKTALDTINSISAKPRKLSNAASAMCSIYDVSKGMTNAIRTAKVAAVAAMAMIVLTASDQTKAGEGDENIMAVVGDMMTQTDENGETATSSLGYREAAYNEKGVLTAEDQKYSMTITNSFVNALSAVTSLVAVGGLVAVFNFNQMCYLINKLDNPLTVLLSCPEEIMTGLLSAAETAGIGAIISMIVCIGKSIFTQLIVSQALSKFLGNVTDLFIKNEVPILDEKSKGASLGNALFSGSSQILGGKAAGYGMKAGNVNQIRQYSKRVFAVKQEEAAIAAYDARETPFDITNQYSFAGSMANKLGVINLQTSSITNNIRNVFTFLPRSFASLSNNAYAEADSKADLYENQCSDANLKTIGVDADQFCNPSYVMSDSELDADINANVQYMIDHGFIDEESGEAKKGTDYQLYLDNCANRVEPLGETSASINDLGYEWKTGQRCVVDESTEKVDQETKEEMSQFRIYTMNKAINDTIDKPHEASSGSGGTTAGTTIDIANLYNDSTNINCAAGTTDAGIADGYTDGNLVKIRLCTIPNTTDDDLGVTQVNSRVSGAYLALINDLIKTTGKSTINTASSFRTMAMQEALQSQGNAAPPGYSNHQMGIAIDYHDATNDYLKPLGFCTPMYPPDESEHQHIEPIK